MPESSKPQKPTIGGLLSNAARELKGFEQGVPYTLKALLIAPGATVHRYLDDHDARITEPVRLFVLVLLVYFAVASLGAVDQVHRRGEWLKQSTSVNV